jgi:hypothetical protein
MNAFFASHAPLTLSLSPSGGEGLDTPPSPSERERVGVRVGACSRICQIIRSLEGVGGDAVRISTYLLAD